MRKLLVISALLLSSTVAMAEESKWAGDVALGYSRTSGNSETASLSALVNTKRDFERWAVSGSFEALNTASTPSAPGSTSGTTAERYLARAQGDRKLGERTALFVRVQWESDRFGGFEQRLSETLGLAHNLIQNDRMTLTADAGAGARHSKTKDVNDPNVDEFLFTLGGHGAYKFTELSSLSEDLTFEIGEESTTSKSVTALKTRISTRFNTTLSYTWKNLSDVPAGVNNHTDTLTALTVGWDY